ncbi:hypothetical protein CDD81_507 [Ophiocordyceps australis]|uniref:Inosine/uridine-preferring nucleoside hydrolase domain-containing protein n=1 Tax=Ophiocordyceps australis TaxID=1399860 RepID=A0A2C5XXU4_9HYPO|nr:hypothetical protein CDD81_507 [Ophiocordyceps australis]
MATAEQIPLWLDCDPGHDDAFAILMAAHHPRFKLLGISTVFGNASLEKTTHNAAALLTAIGKQNVPLYKGYAKALFRPALHAPTDIHGVSGIDGTDLLPEPRCWPKPEPAVPAMAAALRACAPGTAQLIATGALTNVAALMSAEPDLAAHIGGLCLMGGALGGGFTDAPLAGTKDGEAKSSRSGNTTMHAEFNMLVDPEAASQIFSNAVLAAKTTVVPLDLSHQVLATNQVRQLLLHGAQGDKTGPGKTQLRVMLVELLYFFAKTYADVFDITAGPPLHDPIAVAAALIGTPDEIHFSEWDASKSQPPPHRERFRVSIITHGTFEEAKRGDKQTGKMLATELPPGQQGVRIPRSIDVADFWRVLEECIERADAANSAPSE